MEAVVSRMKTIQVSINNSVVTDNAPSMRFLAISATIPNVDDVSLCICLQFYFLSNEILRHMCGDMWTHLETHVIFK